MSLILYIYNIVKTFQIKKSSLTFGWAVWLRQSSEHWESAEQKKVENHWLLHTWICTFLQCDVICKCEAEEFSRGKKKIRMQFTQKKLFYDRKHQKTI